MVIVQKKYSSRREPISQLPILEVFDQALCWLSYIWNNIAAGIILNFVN